MRLPLLALLLPLLIPPAHAAQPEAQEVVLQFEPQPGDKLRQSMEMKMQMSMNMLPGPKTTDEQRAKLAEGAQKLGKGMSMAMKMAIRTEASEADAKGDYLLHIRGEGGEIHMNLPGDEAKTLPNPMADLEIDALLHPNLAGVELLRVKSGQPALKDGKVLDGMAQGLVQQAFGAMRELEGRHLKIGETAEIPFNLQMPMQQLPANAKVNATIAFTLKSVHKGVAHFDTTVKMDMTMNTQAQEAQQVHMNVRGAGTGTMDYRVADRLPMRKDMTIHMQMDTQLPGDVSMQMDTTMQMDMKGERYK
ncbi:MAG: hypothetical protein JO006_20250 [Paucibacter sp.]|nr:hypothetical protein [Roseateles sp.]